MLSILQLLSTHSWTWKICETTWQTRRSYYVRLTKYFSKQSILAGKLSMGVTLSARIVFSSLTQKCSSLANVNERIVCVERESLSPTNDETAGISFRGSSEFREMSSALHKPHGNRIFLNKNPLAALQTFPRYARRSMNVRTLWLCWSRVRVAQFTPLESRASDYCRVCLHPNRTQGKAILDEVKWLKIENGKFIKVLKSKSN